MSQPLVWLITGTSSGFGKELSLALLERGDKVIATARSRSLPKLADLKKRGADVLELDVTASLDQLHADAKTAIAIHGRIDVVVNNAGYVAFGALEENTPEESLSQFNTNVFGGLNVARAFLPHMRARKAGAIVWIGSLAGYRGLASAGLYSASKYAVRGISESLHLEISPLGLRSIVFEPGYFRTDLLTGDNRAPWISRIPDYQPITTKTDREFVAHSGKQQGDPKKGARVIIDVVKGEGAAKDKPFVPVVLLGSDCYQVVKNVLEKDIEKIEDWKKITCSTDYD